MSSAVIKYEDLEVWKESMRLTVAIYKSFKDCKDYGFRDQIRRSAVSIPSNIAEGFERQSSKEFIQFLFIAKGSTAELRTQLYIAIEIGELGKETGKEFIEKSQKISAMLMKLIKTGKEKFK